MKTAKDIAYLIAFEGLCVKCTSLHCYRCQNKVNCSMHVIAHNMVLGGEY